MIKSLTTVLAFAAVVAFLSSNVFAGTQPDPRVCARQYKLCLDNCLQQENAAKKSKQACEAAALAAFNNSNKTAADRATYDGALKKCRDAYNTAMSSVQTCRQNCYTQYINCLNGGYIYG
jgi:hypothetical protein